MSVARVPPETDQGLLVWCEVFSTLIGAAPATYEVLPATATDLTSKFGAYNVALSASTAPATRGPASVLQKNLKKTELLDLVRPLARQINANPNITDVQRQELGLKIRSGPTPIPVPTEMPELDILSVTGRTVKARLHGDTIEHRHKPAGVTGAFIWTFAGETHPENLDAWFFWGQTGKTMIEVDFPSTVEAGTKVWLCAGWVNAKGQIGPVSDPASTYTQFGGMTLTVAQGAKKAA